MDAWKLLDKLTKLVCDEQNCYLNILFVGDYIEIQLMPCGDDIEFEGLMDDEE